MSTKTVESDQRFDAFLNGARRLGDSFPWPSLLGGANPALEDGSEMWSFLRDAQRGPENHGAGENPDR